MKQPRFLQPRLGSKAWLASPSSRGATNYLLTSLAEGSFRPPALARFLTLSSTRSLCQAWLHPGALLQITALHLSIGAIAPRRRRGWVAMSWFLGATHLGLLEDRKRLGLPNTITLLRGNLPALERRLGRWTPVLALASDFIDGKLARSTETETPFGLHADFLADAAFWAWFALHTETSRLAKAAVFAAWVAPVALVGALSIFRGRMIDVPRSPWCRPAAAVQVWLGLRIVRRLFRPQLLTAAVLA